MGGSGAGCGRLEASAALLRLFMGCPADYSLKRTFGSLGRMGSEATQHVSNDTGLHLKSDLPYTKNSGRR